MTMAITRGVSLYSFQDSYYNGNMDLEACVKFVAEELGATGIELLAEQTPVGHYPNPTAKEVGQWKDLMAKYNTVPTCMDSFIDYLLYKGRILTLKEQVAQMEQDLRLASRLGFSCIRVLCPVRAEVVEASAGIAADYNVKMGLEIHAPMSFRAPWMQRYMEMAARVNSKYVGIIPDFGIFQHKPNEIAIRQALAAGAREEIVARMVEVYKHGAPAVAELKAELTPKGLNPAEEKFIMSNSRSCYSEPECLREYQDYLVHFHGKFYEINPKTLEETGINYAEPLRILQEIGFDGSISSEFEGQGFYQTADFTNTAYEAEQLKLHHKMLTKYLGI